MSIPNMQDTSNRMRRGLVLFSRGVGTVLCIAGIFLYVILLGKHNKREDAAGESETTSSLYKYLPIGALSLAVVWNGFSFITHALNAAQWLSQRFRNSVDIFCAVELAVLGYISFIYSLVTEWHDGKLQTLEKVLQIIALVCLSLAGAAHLLFWCYDCTALKPKPLRRDEPESWVDHLHQYSDKLQKTRPLSDVSDYSSNQSQHRNSYPPQRNDSVASRDMYVRPLSVRKSGTGTLRKNSNSFIRPVRPTSSISVPEYVPNGFVTIVNKSRDDIDLPPVSPVSSVSRSDLYRNTSRRSQQSISPPTSPIYTGSPTTRFPIRVPDRTHNRSTTSSTYATELVRQLSHTRSTSTPSPQYHTAPTSCIVSPLTAHPVTRSPPPAEPSKEKAAPPPIYQHPAYQNDWSLEPLDRADTPDIPAPLGVAQAQQSTIAWGANPYNEAGSFMPAFAETGSALSAKGGKKASFVFP